MLTQILGIARNTLIESLRQPVFFIVVLLCGVLQFFNTASSGFAMGYTTSAEVSGDDKLLLDIGLATVFLLGMLLAAFQATAVISREIEDKTILTVVSKPVSRHIVIIGKYLGVVGAILMATIIMIVYLLWAIRHGVMSTAGDTLDGPVLAFGLGSVAISVAAAAWTNYFYGWSFPQVMMTLLLPLTVTGYLVTLAFSPEWELQSLSEDFKPQVTTAAVAMITAVLVFSAVATAASTRLGQVMTIVACSGVFLIGLLSNFLFGRHAFTNQPIAEVFTAEPINIQSEGFDTPGASYTITLESPSDPPIEIGSPIYYGPNPNGIAIAVPAFSPYTGSLTDPDEQFGPGVPSALVVTDIKDNTVLTVRNVGTRPLSLERPPETDDFVFTTPTEINPVAFTAFAVVPNMHYFWMLDAVTQNRPVPTSHLLLVLAYTVTQVGVFLSAAVLLFEDRDVG